MDPPVLRAGLLRVLRGVPLVAAGRVSSQSHPKYVLSNILVSNGQFLAIPWPDKTFHCIALYIPGFDEESRMLRRSLLRWMNLALILVLRSISSAVKQRFPTLDHVVEAGR